MRHRLVGFERPISQNAQGCQGIIQHFLKRHAYSLMINHKKTMRDKTRFTPKMGFGSRTTSIFNYLLIFMIIYKYV